MTRNLGSLPEPHFIWNHSWRLTWRGTNVLGLPECRAPPVVSWTSRIENRWKMSSPNWWGKAGQCGKDQKEVEHYCFAFYLFIFGCAGCSLLHGLSLVAVSRSHSRCNVQASHCGGFCSCSSWAQELWLLGSRALAQKLWCTGLVTESSWTRDQIYVPCIGEWIPYHWTTRGVPVAHILLTGM